MTVLPAPLRASLRSAGVVAAACALLLALASAPGEATPAGLEAGFGRADLTPKTAVPLGGYGARMGRLSTGVHDAIEARAIVLRQGTTQVALVSVDLVGVSRLFLDALRERLGDLGSLDLVLTATHNHAGPGGLSDLPIWRPAMGAFDPRLHEEIVARVEGCVRRAHADLAPACIRTGRIAVPGLQRNRVDEARAVDSRLGVVRIDTPAGAPRGVIVHFAAHPTLLGSTNLQLSAGWPGALRRALERELPGTTTLFLNGAMGDVAPRAPPAPDGPEDAFARVARYGEALARSALRLRGRLDERPPETVALAVGTVHARCHTVFGALLGRRGSPALAGSQPWDLPLTRLQLGEVELVTVPGEPVGRVAEMLVQGRNRWIVSCAQDHLGYFADRALFRRGGYEAELSLFGPRAPEAMAAALAGRSLAVAALPQPALPPHGVVHLDAADARLANGASALGLRHGLVLRGEIQDFLAVAEGHLKREALARGAGLATRLLAGLGAVPPEDVAIPLLVRAARRLQRRIPEEYLDEMEGVARGAEVPYDAVLLENTFLTLAEQTDPAALLALPARCTNVVALGEATSMGQLMHASTLDWGLGALLRERARPMVMEPAEGHAFVSVGWPGMVGTLRAMGAQGLAVTEESCAAPDDTGMDGMPVNLLLRQVVQHTDDLSAAVAAVRETPGTCGYKITISDGHRLDARVVEVTARHQQVRKPERGLLFGCDPDAGPACFDGDCDERIPRADGSSRRRYPALRALLEQAHGRLRTPLASWALSTRNGRVLNEDTLLACVFEPQRGRFHVALGDDVPAGDEGELSWRSYDLPALLSEGARARHALLLRVTETGPVRVASLPMPIPGLERLEVTFESPLPSGHAFNDTVRAELWLPRDPIGVLIELPAWKESTLAGHRLMAMTLARKRIATMILPLPYQDSRAAPGVRSGAWTLSANLARTRQCLFQGLADVARASLWLEREKGFAPARQAVGGVSLGGHYAAVAYGAYPKRFAAGVFLLAGGNVHEAFLESNGTTGRMRDALRARGVTAAEALTLVAPMDPVRYADPRRAAGVLMVAATEDEVVPPANARALAAAYGGVKIEWIPGGHYAAARPDHFLHILRLMSEHCANVFGGG